MKRLRESGFDEIRAKQSLEDNDGDVGASLEALLDEAFGISASRAPDADLPYREEIATLREDEMTAVTSIYGDMFQEKIADKLWVMKMGLDHIIRLAEGGVSDADKKKNQVVDTRPICTYFAKGKCRYGKRCKLRHESPATKETSSSGDSALLPHELFEKALQIEEENPFRLELRFPKDNAYPYQLPYISFSCIKGRCLIWADLVRNRGRIHVF